jgi:hypothetical protein
MLAPFSSEFDPSEEAGAASIHSARVQNEKSPEAANPDERLCVSCWPHPSSSFRSRPAPSGAASLI